MVDDYVALDLTPAELEYLCTHPITDADKMDAAMCAWEFCLESDIFEFWPWGAVDLRSRCALLAPFIHIGYMVADASGYDDAFDWEFVPWFMKTCVGLTEGGHELTPDWLARCRAL